MIEKVMNLKESKVKYIGEKKRKGEMILKCYNFKSKEKIKTVWYFI